MTKQEAISYMIGKIEDIERERLASQLSLEANQKKKNSVDRILKALEEVQIDNENQ